MQFLRNIFSSQDNIDNLIEKNNVRGLIRALEHEDRMVRKRAIVALGKIGNKRAVKPLIAIHRRLKDVGWDICQAAAEALGQIGDARAIDALLGSMRAPSVNDDISDTCAEALGNIGAPAAESVVNLYLEISMARRRNMKTLDRSGKTMTRIGTPAAKALLGRLKACTGSSLGTNQLRGAIEHGLTRIGDAAREPVEVFLQTAEGLNATFARRALQQISKPSKP